MDNPSLADVPKLEYLMRSLKGSAAEAMIQANYKTILEIPKERFGHTRLILDAHVRSLIHLPRLSSDDATSMCKFYGEVTVTFVLLSPWVKSLILKLWLLFLCLL